MLHICSTQLELIERILAKWKVSTLARYWSSLELLNAMNEFLENYETLEIHLN